jgi:2-polyprenyl-3-methyl-5-hydroxy-6-metoxy-1,4-benzoquinol methylase
MVRLRREIEGVRRNHAVPPPSYALDEEACGAVLPQLDRWLLERPVGRILLAGTPRRPLAEALARRGHWVTVADLDEVAVQQWHSTLAPGLAAQLTWMSRPYGDISFGPAVFDCIVLGDLLAGYRDPSWVLAKAVRELKPDGALAVRALVQGPVVVDAPAGSPATVPRWVGGALSRLVRTLQSPLAPLFVDAAAREAIDRGAHLVAARFALPATQLQAWLVPPLYPVHLWVADSRRTLACELLYGAKPGLRRTLRQLIAQVPEDRGLGDDMAAPRCMAWVAERRLGGGLRFQ